VITLNLETEESLKTMNTFKRKSLYAALAGLGALGATGAAEAVNVNPDGLGSALIYPYYTTRTDAAGNTYNSLLSVVNSTQSAKAVKVRFLEGKNSREVLDFNLFLSPYDVWTAAILPSAAGGGARVATADRSCTLPLIPATGVDFVNYAYGVGTSNDNAGGTLDRTREGYVEIIEMGDIVTGSTTYQQITHVNGVPPACDKVTDPQASIDTTSLSGGLFGGMTLINVGAGTDYTEDAVALENFIDPFFGGNYQNAGSQLPDLSQANPATSVVFTNNTIVRSTWARGIDAVSAVLMHDNVMNEFVLDPGTRSGSDWVVTMPTKRFYVANGTGSAQNGLFQRNFNGTAGACDDVSLNIYDREERTTSTPLNFSPPPPTQGASLCWEANVITFNNSNVLNSTNVANVPTSFANGWLKLGFLPTTVTGAVHQLRNSVALSTSPQQGTQRTFLGGGATGLTAATYTGLPVVGFAVQNFSNGLLTVGGVTIGENYGGNFVHKYTRMIQ